MEKTKDDLIIVGLTATEQRALSDYLSPHTHARLCYPTCPLCTGIHKLAAAWPLDGVAESLDLDDLQATSLRKGLAHERVAS